MQFLLKVHNEKKPGAQDPALISEAEKQYCTNDETINQYKKEQTKGREIMSKIYKMTELEEVQNGIYEVMAALNLLQRVEPNTNDTTADLATTYSNALKLLEDKLQAQCYRLEEIDNREKTA